jgi:Ca-activated chloride channel family protein
VQPRSNLVFLIDVSGSMDSPDKLPLLKSSMKMLLGTLKPDDTVAIVTYAGNAGTVIEPTKVSERAKIEAAIDNLNPGGGTAGAAGIEQAYKLAEANLDKEGVNRVILATDGDFNIGASSPDALKTMIEEKRKSGVFLSVLGFGLGNLNDHMMQTLAQNGNGTAAYIDNLNEARKVLVEEASSTLFPIAKDVKIQVEFNPATVAEYRLIGYETRALAREDFNNDAVDAGEIGAGHEVTAIYEITPVGGPVLVDASRYAAKPEAAKVEDASAFNNEYAFLKLRYKLPNEDVSKLLTTPVTKANETATPSTEVKWAAAVAGFGQLLKGGQYMTGFGYDDVLTLAQEAKGADADGYRAEFISMVKLADTLAE